MKQGDQLTGFSIDLWNEIAARLKWTTNYQVAPDVDALLGSLRTKSADVIVTGIFYSTERDQEFDFSYPIMESGLQVMVRDEGGGMVPTPLKPRLPRINPNNCKSGSPLAKRSPARS